ncbi:MAG: hypothetical protein H7Y11_03155 [Armatimonadetes bacterium]|nr:hypothetical protein [Anaerolineae bacterium]
MNFFGMGETELLVIVVMALIIAGPKRMIEWMYVLGRWTGRLRTMWAETSALLQKEIDATGIDMKVPKELPTRQNITRMAQTAMKPLNDSAKAAMNEVKQVERDIKNSAALSNGSPAKSTTPNIPITPVLPKPDPTAAPTTPASASSPESGFGTWSAKDE